MAIMPTAISEVDKVIKELEEAKKDEQDAQKMYQKIAADTGLVANIGDLPFMSSFMNASREILRIKDQEREHEQKFNKFIKEAQEAKRKLEEYIKKQNEDEKRKKSQTGTFKPPAIVKPYGRR